MDEFTKKHLLSMCGLPDAVGGAALVLDKVIAAAGLKDLAAVLKEMRDGLLDFLLKRATGMTAAEFKRLLGDPENQFDPVLDRPPLPNGHRTSRAGFDQAELKLGRPPAGWIDLERVPPAYNTVVLCKLALLPPAEVNRLMADLGSADRLAEPNAMLGFAETLDGSNQWQANPRKMVAARNPAAYRRLFMRQTGER